MSKKRGRHITSEKEAVFLEIVEHIESHLDEHFNIRILGNRMEEKLRGENVSYFTLAN